MDSLPLSIWLLCIVDTFVLVLAIRRIPYRAFLREKGLQHLLFGSLVFLSILWRLRAGLSEGLEIHFLGLTALTLILGWDIAICAGVLICIFTTAMLNLSWNLLPLDVLCKVIFPVLTTVKILKVAEGRLPSNFFIYFFVCAFLTGGLTGALAVIAKGGYLVFSGLYPWQQIADEYFLYLPLVIFPEAFLNGTAMIGMLVYLPDWVRTFDSKRYLDGR